MAANFVRAIVLAKAVTIGPRKYVPVDAYQAIANAMGCVASARDVRKVESGWTAIGEVRRLSDGKVLAEGEGFVGNDEPKWSKGPEYAARSMAQTRAIGRACRAAFAFVVPMIDLGLQPTPAEEMEALERGTENPPAPAVTKPVTRGVTPLREALRPSPPKPSNEPPHTADATFTPDAQPATHDRNHVPKFSNKKNEALHQMTERDLKWRQSALTANIADPARQNFVDSNRRELALVEAELAFRGL